MSHARQTGVSGRLGSLAILASLVVAVAGGCGSAPAVSGASPGSTGSGTAANAGGASAGTASATVHLYSSVTQATIDAVVTAFAKAEPGVKVDVFRAPTGDLNARIAAEQQSGGLKADVLWLTDPLSMQGFDAQGLLATWTPTELAAVPAQYSTPTSWGTRLLDVVLAYNTSLGTPPASWKDLTAPGMKGKVAIPDPRFAGSAFAALGWFGLADGYGLDFYRALKANGAAQLKAPDDVVTGVAKGQYAAGMTLDTSAAPAIAKGSPIGMAWPSPGAIAVYSPVAVVGSSPNADAAKAFVNFILSKDGQAAIAASGWQPIRADVGGPKAGGPTVSPDWTAAVAKKQQLLDGYAAIFGG